MWAEVLLALLLWVCVAPEPIAHQKYRLLDDGRCGSPFFSRGGVTIIHCAILCSIDPRCQGFNYAGDVDNGGLCEVTDHVTYPDTRLEFNCYVRDDLYWFFATKFFTETTMEPTTPTYINATEPTTDLYSTTTTTTTTITTAAPTVAGPVSETSNLGGIGLQTIGFKDSSDSFLSSLVYYVPGPGGNPPPALVPSVVLTDGGEVCPADQVMVNMGPLNTGNSEKDDQRMFCSSLTPPLKLSTTCEEVVLGQFPRPSLQDVDTSTWINWLACPTTYMMTGLDWVFDTGAAITQYRYFGARCCQVLTT